MRKINPNILFIVTLLVAPAAFAGVRSSAEELQAVTVSPPPELPAEVMKHMKEMMGRGEGPSIRGGTEKEPLAGMLERMVRMLSGAPEAGSMKLRTMMDHAFYLDRAVELGLTDEQTMKLRAVRAACRRDNIRTAAEIKIARLDLEDLLAGDWTLEEAEKAIRAIQTRQGDMQVRHLRAIREAEKILTAEQLNKLGKE